MQETPKGKRVTTTFSFSAKGHELLNKIAEYNGITKTSWFEMMIREEARKLGLE